MPRKGNQNSTLPTMFSCSANEFLMSFWGNRLSMLTSWLTAVYVSIYELLSHAVPKLSVIVVLLVIFSVFRNSKTHFCGVTIRKSIAFINAVGFEKLKNYSCFHIPRLNHKYFCFSEEKILLRRVGNDSPTTKKFTDLWRFCLFFLVVSVINCIFARRQD